MLFLMLDYDDSLNLPSSNLIVSRSRLSNGLQALLCCLFYCTYCGLPYKTSHAVFWHVSVDVTMAAAVVLLHDLSAAELAAHTNVSVQIATLSQCNTALPPCTASASGCICRDRTAPQID